MAENSAQMTSGNPNLSVDQFILEQIDTVPHLEAFLLVWSKRPKAWSVNEVAGALYVPAEITEKVLRDLVQRGLLSEQLEFSGRYQYRSSSAQWDDFIAVLHRTYSHELIRVSKLIHSKAPSAVQEFARAFRFTKEKD